MRMSWMIMFCWTYQQSQGNGLENSYLILTWLDFFFFFFVLFFFYLETVIDVNKRKCLTRFRVSAHRLETESGGCKKKSVSERICKFCNNLKQCGRWNSFLCNCSATLFYGYYLQSTFFQNTQLFGQIDMVYVYMWEWNCVGWLCISTFRDKKMFNVSI